MEFDYRKVLADKETVKLLPLVAVGLGRAVLNVYLRPAIEDLIQPIKDIVKNSTDV